jgi:outer membrane protein
MAAGLLLTPFAASADVAGVRIGGGSWDWEVSGQLRYQSTDVNDTFDFKSDLGLKDDKQSFGYLVIEHPVPVLPNIRLSKTDLSTTGSGSISVSKTYGGVTYTAAETLSTELVLDQTDLALYYELLDNDLVGFDLGLNLKNISGKASVTGSVSGTASDSFDVTVPMLYAGLEVGLPLTGLSIGADGSYIGYDGNSLTDVTAYIRYTSDYFFGVEAGVRTISLELDDVDSTYGKLDFDGPYVSLFLQF